MSLSGKPLFFGSPKEFAKWLEEHHSTKPEVIVGFYKAGTGHPTLSWSDAVDEALCYGWIDGIRKGIDDERYQIRFTPRKPGSRWSALNLKKAKTLIKSRRMEPSGLSAWKERTESTGYAYEKSTVPSLSPAEERTFQANEAAWRDWTARPPSYRKTVTNWITSAKRQETRESRLATLIQCSAANEVIPPMRFGKRK